MPDKPGDLLDSPQTSLEPGNDFKHKMRVLDIVSEKGASYPSEISMLSSMSTSKAAEVCHAMKRDEILEAIPIDDRRVLNRRKDMWERGNKGKDDFKKISWYGVREYINGRKVLLVDKQGNTRDVYGEILEQDFEERESLKSTVRKAMDA